MGGIARTIQEEKKRPSRVILSLASTFLVNFIACFCLLGFCFFSMFIFLFLNDKKKKPDPHNI